MDQVYPGTSLLSRLEQADLDKLGARLCELIDDEEKEHAGYFRNLEIWLKWYEAEPAITRKTFPWDAASNIVVPYIKIWSNNAISRLYNPLQILNKTWVGDTDNSEFRDGGYVDPVVRFLNKGAQPGGRFDISMALLDAVSEMVIMGSSVWKLTWQQKMRWHLHPRTMKPLRVALGSGPVLEHIPAKNILWRYDRSIDQSDLVIEKHLMSWNELRSMCQFDDWDEECIEKDRGSFNTGGPDSGIEAAQQKFEGLSHVRSNLYDIRSVSIDMPLLKASEVIMPGSVDDDPDLRVTRYVVHLNKDTRRVYQVRAYPYLLAGWNYYDVYRQKRTGRFSSAGYAKDGEGMQRGATTLVNQIIDALTLANSVNGKTSDPKLYEQKFSPNKWIKVADMASFEPLQLSKQVIPDVTVVNMLANIGERLMNIPDPMQGQETRMGGHPAPATSTLTQLSQGDKVLKTTSFFLGRQISRIGQDIAALYQQWETDQNGWIEREFGSDAQKIKKWILADADFLVGTLTLDLHALSETANPDTERQKAIMLSQVGAQYSALMTQYAAAFSNPQTPPLAKEILQQSMKTQTALYQRVLEASDINEVERFVIDLRQAFSQFGQQLGQLPQTAGMGAGGAAAPAAPPAQPGALPATPGAAPIPPMVGPGNGATGPPQ